MTSMIFIKILQNTIQIKKHKTLFVSDDVIADILSNKKFNLIVTELFIRGIKLNISFVFTMQSCFSVPRNSRLNSTHYFIMKIWSKWDIQQIVFSHLWDIDFENFMSICKKCTAKPYSFLVIDCTFVSHNPLCFRKNLLEKI